LSIKQVLSLAAVMLCSVRHTALKGLGGLFFEEASAQQGPTLLLCPDSAKG
jgi:hypothetical protein